MVVTSDSAIHSLVTCNWRYRYWSHSDIQVGNGFFFFVMSSHLQNPEASHYIAESELHST